MTLTPQQQQALDAALALVQTVGPKLGPNGAILAGVVTAGAAAISAAMASGGDVTDVALYAIFDKFSANAADDMKAQRDARAGGDMSGDTPG